MKGPKLLHIDSGIGGFAAERSAFRSASGEKAAYNDASKCNLAFGGKAGDFVNSLAAPEKTGAVLCLVPSRRFGE